MTEGEIYRRTYDRVFHREYTEIYERMLAETGDDCAAIYIAREDALQNAKDAAENEARAYREACEAAYHGERCDCTKEDAAQDAGTSKGGRQNRSEALSQADSITAGPVRQMGR